MAIAEEAPATDGPSTATADRRETAAAVEESAPAHLFTDAPGDARDRWDVPVGLRYDPGADPRAVRMSLPAGTDRDWVFTRDLLERGMRAPAGSGDVRIWPCGRVQTVVELRTAEGVAVVQFDAWALARFLRRTYTVTAKVPATGR